MSKKNTFRFPNTVDSFKAAIATGTIDFSNRVVSGDFTKFVRSKRTSAELVDYILVNISNLFDENKHPNIISDVLNNIFTRKDVSEKSIIEFLLKSKKHRKSNNWIYTSCFHRIFSTKRAELSSKTINTIYQMLSHDIHGYFNYSSSVFFEQKACSIGILEQTFDKVLATGIMRHYSAYIVTASFLRNPNLTYELYIRLIANLRKSYSEQVCVKMVIKSNSQFCSNQDIIACMEKYKKSTQMRSACLSTLYDRGVVTFNV